MGSVTFATRKPRKSRAGLQVNRKMRKASLATYARAITIRY